MNTITDDSTGVSAVATELRSATESFMAALERREKLQAEMKAVEAEFNRAKAKLIDVMASDTHVGLDGFRRDGLRVDLKEEIDARIEPGRVADVIRWALDGGHVDVIDCRPSGSKIAALIKEGVGVPEGILIESKMKLNWKRE